MKKAWGLLCAALLMGSAVCGMPSYTLAEEPAASQETALVFPGIKETALLDTLKAGGWTAVEGTDRTYMLSSSKAKSEKELEHYISYVADNGTVTQITNFYKCGNKGVAEKKFKDVSKSLESLLGRWSCDVLISKNENMADKYNMWALPDKGILAKVSWNRDPDHPFLKSEKTEKVSVFLCNY